MATTYTFKDNKYTRWYYAIIAKRAIKDWRRKGEVHHIMPSSLGGSDDRSNLVKLTGHDHAWCHWLLTKMTEGEAKSKMVYAFNMMGVYGDHMERGMSYAIVRAYEKNRLEWSKNHSAKMTGKEPWNKGLDMKDDPRCKGGKKNKGRVMDPSVGEATRVRQTGKKQSIVTRVKRSKSMTGFVRGPMSEEDKLTRKLANLGGKKPEGHGDAVAAANRGVTIINKDGVEKRVKDDLQSWLALGWAKGRPPKQSTKRGPYKKNQAA
jgi:hypothetical protein